MTDIWSGRARPLKGKELFCNKLRLIGDTWAANPANHWLVFSLHIPVILFTWATWVLVPAEGRRRRWEKISLLGKEQIYTGQKCSWDLDRGIPHVGSWHIDTVYQSTWMPAAFLSSFITILYGRPIFIKLWPYAGAFSVCLTLPPINSELVTNLSQIWWSSSYVRETVPENTRKSIWREKT